MHSIKFHKIEMHSINFHKIEKQFGSYNDAVEQNENRP